MTGVSRSALAAAVLFAVLAFAQAAETIQGTVHDSSGKAVPGALVVCRNTVTGSAFRQKTNLEGQFAFEALQPAQYWVAVSRDGFSGQGRLVEHRGVSQVDFALEIAGQLQQVTVVSSSRTEELRETAPVKVDALTREDMRDTGYERVSDALAEIPGVLTRRGATAGVAGEQIQGIDSRQVLVLQDGLPIIGARGVKSGALNLHRQSAARLERVEVVKGAASALYGSDAIGGVINLISREPSNPLEANLNVSGGSLGGVDARADVGTQIGNFSAFLDLERHQQDSYGLVPSSPVTVGPEFRRTDLLLRARYALRPQAVFGLSANGYHNHEAGKAIAETGLAETISNDSSQNYALSGDFLLPQSTTLQVRGYAARYDENSLVLPVAAVANLNERYHRLDATASRNPGARQFIQAGGEWVQNVYRGVNRILGDNAGQQVTTTDAWFQDRIQLSSRAVLTLGGRLQDHSRFGVHPVPKAGLVVRAAGNLILRAGYGHGFRAPDLGQLYYRFANPGSFYQVIGNPNLRPETSRSLSAGAVYTAGRYRLGLNLYRNQVSDLIESQLLGRPTTAADLEAIELTYGIPHSFQPLLGRQLYLYRNLNRIYTRGFEVDGAASLGKGLRVRGAYTFLDARDRVSGLALTQRHRHHGFIAADYAHRRLGLNANLRGSLFSSYLLNAQSGARAYPYRIWDVYGSKPLGRGASLYAAVDNLFDSTDRKLALPSPTFDRPDYGRTYRVGLRYSFIRERN